jgi:sterol desaturase/sphingolipid hydroxylase (fatty acid hydroxylase superfamily)
MFLVEFVAIFLFILVFGYLLPAGWFYYLYYVRPDPAKEQQRIQQRRPTPGQIQRELKLSLLTILVFAVMATALFQLYKQGMTAIYRNIHDYPMYYLPISFVLCLVIHDTYFYWTHRLMHLPSLFKYVHAGHHRSIAPTPWAIFAFQPLEAVIQFFGISLIVVLLPLHPLVLLLFLSYDTLVNTAGHTGYEMVPQAASKHWLFKWFNTVTHHDNHHTNLRKNFAVFFTFWDWRMGTLLDERMRHPSGVANNPSPPDGFKVSAAKPRQGRLFTSGS